jgi:3'(2'), 5'-bisphosphate nucleotidase
MAIPSGPELTPMFDAALAGARAVMEVYATEFSVERKADDSPVSEADRRAEAAILAVLSAALPDIPIVAEEAVSAGDIPSLRAASSLSTRWTGPRSSSAGTASSP